MNDQINPRQENSVDMHDDDDDDAFLPPDFVPEELPVVGTMNALSFIQDDCDVISPSSNRKEFLRWSISSLDDNHKVDTLMNDTNNKITSQLSARKDYLRQSISALKDSGSNQEEFVDLLGLQTLEKDNFVKQIDPFCLWTANGNSNTVVVTEPINVLLTNHVQKVCNSNEALTSPPTSNSIDSKLDMLAADLQAEVDAGTLFLKTINTPLRVTSKQPILNDNQTALITAQQEFTSQRKHQQRIVDEQEQEIERLNVELNDTRREFIEQQELISQLNVEIQQLALSTAAEQHVIQEQCQQYKKELEYVSTKMKIDNQTMEQLQSNNTILLQERDSYHSDLLHKQEELAQLEQEKLKSNEKRLAEERALFADKLAIQQEKDQLLVEYRNLQMEHNLLLINFSSMETSLLDITKHLDQLIASGEESCDKLRISEELVESLTSESSRAKELLATKDDLITKLQYATTTSDEQVETIARTMDHTKNLLHQMEKERTDILAVNEAHIHQLNMENEDIRTQNVHLAEQLQHAEDLALLVAADNDAMQLQLQTLQGELHACKLSKESLEKSNDIKDGKIRSLQRYIGAVESLLNDSPADDNGKERSLQRRIGFLKDKHEQQVNELNKRKDDEILSLEEQVTKLKHEMQYQELDLKLHAAQESQDKAKNRSLKRRIGATESLLEEEMNQSSSEITERDGLIRSLQRRIGHLSNEINNLSEKYSNFDELLHQNKVLETRLTASDSMVEALKKNISELEEDLTDAYEKDDQMQEDFVQAMMYATLEVENLHAVYSQVFQHLQQQYVLMEEELLDSLEREEDLKDEQERLAVEFNDQLKTLEEYRRKEMKEAAEKIELLREDYLMKTVDIFKQCYHHFQVYLESGIAEVKLAHESHLDVLVERHLAEKVSLFRDFMTLIVPKSLTDVVESTEDLSLSVINDNLVQQNNETEVKIENLISEDKVAALQSPGSAFVPYSNKKVKVQAQAEYMLLQVLKPKESSNFISQPQASEMVNSSKSTDPNIRKSLNFATPEKVKLVSTGLTSGVLQKFHSTPKTDTVKAKLRLLENSRSKIGGVVGGNENIQNSKLGLHENVDKSRKVEGGGKSVVKVSSLAHPNQRCRVLVQRSGIVAPKSIVQALRTRPGVEVQSQISQPANLKRTIKAKLDTGLVKPTLKSRVPSAASAAPVKKEQSIKSNTEVRRLQTRAKVQYNAVLASSIKPRSRLPQFNSGKTSSPREDSLRTKSSTTEKVQDQNFAKREDLFQKMAQITSTPLVSHSKHSDFILSMSTKKVKVETRCVTGTQTAPRSQIPSANVTSHFMDFHFTPIQNQEGTSESSSPLSPLLVTPKAESIPPLLIKKNRLIMDDAAIKIQALYRGQRTRTFAQSFQKNIIRIQTLWRGNIYQKAFLFSIRRIVLIQALLRRKLAGIKVKKLRLAIRKSNAAIKIQSFSRHVLATKHRTIRCNEKLAATTLQSYWRRLRCRLLFVNQKKAALLIQDIIRRKNATSLSIKMKIISKHVTLIHYYILKLSSAVKIQSSFRRFMATNAVNEMKMQSRSAIRIQKMLRAFQCQRDYTIKRASALTIQAIARRIIASAVVNEMRTSKSNAALVIQSTWRSVRNQRIAALKIQLCVRKFRASIVVQQMRTKARSVTKIQSIFRAAKCNREYILLRLSVIKIQLCIRRFIISRIEQQLIVKTKNVLQIQSKWRSFKCQRTFFTKRSAAIRIQSHARRVCETTVVRQMKSNKYSENAIKIQRMWRSLRCRRAFLTKRSSAVLIQSLMRRTSANAAVEQQYIRLRSVIHIQRTWRRAMNESRYKHVLVSAVFLQTSVRGYLARKFLRNHKAALLIQSYVRMWNIREQYTTLQFASIAVQSIVRRHLARVALQMMKKRVLCAVTIQAYSRMVFCQKRFHTAKKSALFLQRWIRLQKFRFKVQRYVGSLRLQLVVPATVQTTQQVIRLSIDCTDRRLNQRSSKKRVALGDISNSAQKVARRNTNMKPVTIRDVFHEGETVNKDNMDIDNVAVALESLSIALSRAKEESSIHSIEGESKRTFDKVEKLKVTDLRQELKSYGLESRRYNKLRKSELVALVVEQRESHCITSNHTSM